MSGGFGHEDRLPRGKFRDRKGFLLSLFFYRTPQGGTVLKCFYSFLDHFFSGGGGDVSDNVTVQDSFPRINAIKCSSISLLRTQSKQESEPFFFLNNLLGLRKKQRSATPPVAALNYI